MTRLRWKVEQGATFKRTITYKTSSNLPVSLVGAIVTIRLTPKDRSTITYSTETGHVVLTSPTQGKCVFTIPYTETSSFTNWKTGNFDVNILFPNGTNQRIFSGTMTVDPRA